MYIMYIMTVQRRYGLNANRYDDFQSKNNTHKEITKNTGQTYSPLKP